MTEKYGADYFLHGRATGTSLYEDYRWMPDLTVPMVQAIIKHLGVTKEDVVLDFGCARGYVVRALRELGHHAFGYDVSKWAVDNADASVHQYLTCTAGVAFGATQYDWIIAKDVLEHIEYVEVTIVNLMLHARKGVFAVVPLSMHNGNPYVIADYEKDVTHKQRITLTEWSKMFTRLLGWRVELSYRVPGVKDNWYKPGWERGNGFITARRIEGT